MGPGDTECPFFITDSRIKTTFPLNYELQQEYVVYVKVEDRSGEHLSHSFTQRFEIMVLDDNDVPTRVRLDNTTVPVRPYSRAP